MANKYTGLLVLARVRVILALVVVLGIIAAAGSGGTLAYFTSTATSTGNTFTAGSMTLQSGGGAVRDAFVTAASKFRPGQAALGQVELKLATNDVDAGSMSIAITRVGDTGAGKAMDKRINWTAKVYDATQASCTGTGPSDTTTLPAGGTTLTVLPGRTTPTATADGTQLTTTSQTFVAQTNDLALTGGASPVSKFLCVRAEWVNGTDTDVTIPTDNAGMGAAGDYTFDFTAYQINAAGTPQ